MGVFKQVRLSSLMLVLWLLFLGEIATAAASSGLGPRALLQQPTGVSTKTSVPGTTQSSGASQGKDPPGYVFDVKSRGGAKKFLDSLGASKVERILRNSKQKGGRAQLEKLLEGDSDLVSIYRWSSLTSCSSSLMCCNHWPDYNPP